MAQQTAIEWIIEQFAKYYAIHQLDEEIEQAKQMEKEQIIDAFFDGAYDADNISGEQYYNEAYGSSTPELRHKDGTPMRKYNSPKLKAIEMENELEEAAENYGWKIKTNTFSDAVKANELAESAKQDFIEGAKWQQETSAQTEISDEEIEKSNPFRIDGGAYNSSAAYQWLKGAKWYREQLKQKL